MSNRQLGRVEALARVRSKQLRLADAARLLRVCYRQAALVREKVREHGIRVQGSTIIGLDRRAWRQTGCVRGQEGS